MVTLMKPLKLRRGERRAAPEPELAAAAAPAAPSDPPPVDIPPGDPLVALLADRAAPVNLDHVDFDSPGVAALREAGIKVVVPLITQGELIGTLNLGPRLSEQEYSRDDLRLLDSLAAQAAPAVRVAQLLQQQERDARERERVAHELRVARLIQSHFLPQQLPELDGWDMAVEYRPAREVGGDFYDFIDLPGGRLGVVVADVTDKGVPAAMVMAATRTLLRATSQRLDEPGEVLARVNSVLAETTPPNMFITCLYGILDPSDGSFVFANAGHNLPCVATEAGVVELRARGMPLALMPGMTYEEAATTLAVGDTLLLYSDGIVEAHDPGREMFGFPRLQASLGEAFGAAAAIDHLLTELAAFTGPEWEQEDDVTVVCLRREGEGGAEEVLDEFAVPSVPGNERIAMERVAAAVAGLGLPDARLERLKTAVAEATMNALEHGNHHDPDRDAGVQVRASDRRIVVAVSDDGEPGEPRSGEIPDLDAKLAGEQSPRGWGLFLIERMVDEMRTTTTAGRHTLELVMNREASDAATTA